MSLFDDPRVAELIGPEFARSVGGIFRAMEIAEEEIAEARGTTKVDKDDPVWDAFALLRTTDPLMSTEFVYRAHCRELLERVKAGEDTRPATDAEIACGITRASHEVPMHGAIVGLQARLFKRAFPDKFDRLGIDLDLYERMHGREMDEWERKLRRKAAQDWRVSGRA